VCRQTSELDHRGLPAQFGAVLAPRLAAGALVKASLSVRNKRDQATRRVTRKRRVLRGRDSLQENLMPMFRTASKDEGLPKSYVLSKISGPLFKIQAIDGLSCGY
jgi:hypothetical protein